MKTPDPVSDARRCKRRSREYEQVQRQLKSLDTDKRSGLNTLQHWLQAKGVSNARLEGREKTRTVPAWSGAAATRSITSGSTRCSNRTCGPRS